MEAARPSSQVVEPAASVATAAAAPLTCSAVAFGSSPIAQRATPGVGSSSDSGLASGRLLRLRSEGNRVDAWRSIAQSGTTPIVMRPTSSDDTATGFSFVGNDGPRQQICTSVVLASNESYGDGFGPMSGFPLSLGSLEASRSLLGELVEAVRPAVVGPSPVVVPVGKSASVVAHNRFIPFAHNQCEPLRDLPSNDAMRARLKAPSRSDCTYLVNLACLAGGWPAQLTPNGDNSTVFVEYVAWDGSTHKCALSNPLVGSAFDDGYLLTCCQGNTSKLPIQLRGLPGPLDAFCGGYLDCPWGVQWHGLRSQPAEPSQTVQTVVVIYDPAVSAATRKEWSSAEHRVRCEEQNDCMLVAVESGKKKNNKKSAAMSEHPPVVQFNLSAHGALFEADPALTGMVASLITRMSLSQWDALGAKLEPNLRSQPNLTSLKSAEEHLVNKNYRQYAEFLGPRYVVALRGPHEGQVQSSRDLEPLLQLGGGKCHFQLNTSDSWSGCQWCPPPADGNANSRPMTSRFKNASNLLRAAFHTGQAESDQAHKVTALVLASAAYKDHTTSVPELQEKALLKSIADTHDLMEVERGVGASASWSNIVCLLLELSGGEEVFLSSATEAIMKAAQLAVTANAAPPSGSALGDDVLLRLFTGLGVVGLALFSNVCGGSPPPSARSHVRVMLQSLLSEVRTSGVNADVFLGLVASVTKLPVFVLVSGIGDPPTGKTLDKGTKTCCAPDVSSVTMPVNLSFNVSDGSSFRDALLRSIEHDGSIVVLADAAGSCGSAALPPVMAYRRVGAWFGVTSSDCPPSTLLSGVLDLFRVQVRTVTPADRVREGSRGAEDPIVADLTADDDTVLCGETNVRGGPSSSRTTQHTLGQSFEWPPGQGYDPPGDGQCGYNCVVYHRWPGKEGDAVFLKIARAGVFAAHSYLFNTAINTMFDMEALTENGSRLHQANKEFAHLRGELTNWSVGDSDKLRSALKGRDVIVESYLQQRRDGDTMEVDHGERVISDLAKAKSQFVEALEPSLSQMRDSIEASGVTSFTRSFWLSPCAYGAVARHFNTILWVVSQNSYGETVADVYGPDYGRPIARFDAVFNPTGIQFISKEGSNGEATVAVLPPGVTMAHINPSGVCSRETQHRELYEGGCLHDSEMVLLHSNCHFTTNQRVAAPRPSPHAHHQTEGVKAATDAGGGEDTHRTNEVCTLYSYTGNLNVHDGLQSSTKHAREVVEKLTAELPALLRVEAGRPASTLHHTKTLVVDHARDIKLAYLKESPLSMGVDSSKLIMLLTKQFDIMTPVFREVLYEAGLPPADGGATLFGIANFTLESGRHEWIWPVIAAEFGVRAEWMAKNAIYLCGKGKGGMLEHEASTRVNAVWKYLSARKSPRLDTLSARTGPAALKTLSARTVPPADGHETKCAATPSSLAQDEDDPLAAKTNRKANLKSHGYLKLPVPNLTEMVKTVCELATTDAVIVEARQMCKFWKGKAKDEGRRQLVVDIDWVHCDRTNPSPLEAAVARVAKAVQFAVESLIGEPLADMKLASLIYTDVKKGNNTKPQACHCDANKVEANTGERKRVAISVPLTSVRLTEMIDQNEWTTVDVWTNVGEVLVFQLDTAHRGMPQQEDADGCGFNVMLHFAPCLSANGDDVVTTTPGGEGNNNSGFLPVRFEDLRELVVIAKADYSAGEEASSSRMSDIERGHRVQHLSSHPDFGAVTGSKLPTHFAGMSLLAKNGGSFETDVKVLPCSALKKLQTLMMGEVPCELSAKLANQVIADLRKSIVRLETSTLDIQQKKDLEIEKLVHIIEEQKQKMEERRIPPKQMPYVKPPGFAVGAKAGGSGHWLGTGGKDENGMDEDEDEDDDEAGCMGEDGDAHIRSYPTWRHVAQVDSDLAYQEMKVFYVKGTRFYDVDKISLLTGTHPHQFFAFIKEEVLAHHKKRMEGDILPKRTTWQMYQNYLRDQLMCANGEAWLDGCDALAKNARDSLKIHGLLICTNVELHTNGKAGAVGTRARCLPKGWDSRKGCPLCISVKAEQRLQLSKYKMETADASEEAERSHKRLLLSSKQSGNGGKKSKGVTEDFQA